MKLFGVFRSSSTKMDEKLFDELLIIIVIMSFANIIGNLIITFPFEANYKWIFMIFLTYIVNKYKYSTTWVKFSFILFIILVILPLGWYQSGVDNNNVIAYIFLIIIATTFIFKDYQRLILIAILTLVFITFITIQLEFPDFLPNYNIDMILADRLLQIPLAIYIAFLMLRQFDSAYIENSNQLNILNNELKILAFTDSLTGIHNRAFIFQKFNLAITEKEDFITVIIDIDDFKTINDNYGHIIGDVVLNNFANLLAQKFSTDGYVARYGGDEFIMMLTITPTKLLEKMEEFNIEFNKQDISKNYNATYSAGYGQYNGQSLDKYLQEVDKALYKAKNKGKDMILSI